MKKPPKKNEKSLYREKRHLKKKKSMTKNSSSKWQILERPRMTCRRRSRGFSEREPGNFLFLARMVEMRKGRNKAPPNISGSLLRKTLVTETVKGWFYGLGVIR